MTLRISFVGPIAAGLAEDKEPTAADLLDLFDERIYRTRWPDDPYELQFAGIAALIACCGAWPKEIARLETTDISVKNVPPGANTEAGETADNGIRLGSGKYRRRLWMPEAARTTLARVTGRIAPAGGCTRLFKRRDGTAMSGQENLLRHPNKLDLSPRRRGMGPRMHQNTFLTHARRHPDKTASQIASWLGERGIQTRKQNLIMIARREGVKLANPQGVLRNGRDPKRVEAHMRRHPEHTVLDVQAWAREALGREISTMALYHFAETRGLRFASCFQLAGTNADRVEEHLRANPDTDIHQLVAWIELELKMTVAIGTVRAFLRRRGLKTRKLPTGHAPYGSELLAWIRANPEAEVSEALAWLRAELSVDLALNTLHSFLNTHRIKLCPSKGGTRAPYGPALLAWLGTHPEADLDGAMAWLASDPGFQASRVTVRVFLARRGINLRGNRPA